jgi:hypothetical protein
MCAYSSIIFILTCGGIYSSPSESSETRVPELSPMTLSNTVSHFTAPVWMLKEINESMTTDEQVGEHCCKSFPHQ